LPNKADATLHISLLDTRVDISNAMTVLETNAYVNSLTVSDRAALNITETQFAAGATERSSQKELAALYKKVTLTASKRGRIRAR
jgi:hypothetical protein